MSASLTKLRPSQTPQAQVKDDANSARIAAWRQKREKVAEASKQERLRLAEAQRQERMRQFERDKEHRVKAAAEARAQEEATRRVERLTSARAKLADRGDLDAARQRIAAHRRQGMQRLGLRLAVIVGLPVLLVGAYLFAVATPLYQAEARFVVTGAPPTAAPTLETGAVLSRVERRTPAFMARDMILSEEMFATLNDKDAFAVHFGATEVDPLLRLRPVKALGIDAVDQYRRHVDVGLNPSEGSVILRVRARDEASAERFAATILATVESKLAVVQAASGTAADAPPIVTYLAPRAAPAPAFPRPLPTLLLTLVVATGLYAIGSVLGSTLSRHAAR